VIPYVAKCDCKTCVYHNIPDIKGGDQEDFSLLFHACISIGTGTLESDSLSQSMIIARIIRSVVHGVF